MGGNWVKKAELRDTQASVNKIEFAPRHLGLKLASCSSDGYVRIYEAVDIMNLLHWPLQDEFQAFDNEDSERKQKVEATSLSWCTGRNDGAILVVGGSGGQIRVWKYDESARLWSIELDIISEDTRSRINDIAWAPTAGKSFHQIASCSSDGIRVHRLVYKYGNNQQTENGLSNNQMNLAGRIGEKSGKRPQLQLQESTALKYNPPQSFAGDTQFRHNEVWRVAWNITGTLIVTSGEEGNVVLWKKNFQGKWLATKTIHGVGSH